MDYLCQEKKEPLQSNKDSCCVHPWHCITTGKTVKLGNLDEVMLEKRNSDTKIFWEKEKVFLELYFLTPFFSA